MIPATPILALIPLLILAADPGLHRQAGPEFEILTPADGSQTSGRYMALIVQPNSRDLIVELNGARLAPFQQNALQRDYAHARIDLVPGENRLEVLQGDSSHALTLWRRPDALVGKHQRAVDQTHEFHLPEREAPCRPCHRMDVDERTRKPRSEEDLSCAECHTEELNANFLHGPMGAFLCMGCHANREAASGSGYALAVAEPALCYRCHRNVAEATRNTHVHGLLGSGQCTLCHDPHGSPHKFQLHIAGSELCGGCHSDITRGLEMESASVHAIVGSGQCTACHAPHASQNRFCLRAPLNALCFQCHDRETYADLKHPVAQHPIRGVPDPQHPSRELSCVSCHDPHWGQTAPLLRTADHLQLCKECHKF